VACPSRDAQEKVRCKGLELNKGSDLRERFGKEKDLYHEASSHNLAN
jgi:hypothetical protein